MNNQPDPNNPISSYDAQPATQSGFGSVGQSLVMAIVGGTVAAVVGAILWGLIVAVTKFESGFVAIGVGLIVGVAVHFFGRGASPIFGIIGAVLSLISIGAGKLLAVAFAASNELKIPLTEALIDLTKPGVAAAAFQASFSGIDILFYLIALYEGYRFSISGFQSRRRR